MWDSHFETDALGEVLCSEVYIRELVQSDSLLNSCEQATSMDTNKTSIWTDNPRLLLNYSNDTLGGYNSFHTNKTNSLNIVILIVSVLGLPGNLLLIAVYVRKMTTSTRVYMFALAVGDSIVCLCVIVLCLTRHFRKSKITVFILDVSVTFSMFLLVFVAIERLIAVRHPHSFNMKAQRAKIALLIIAVAAVVYTTIVYCALLFNYTLCVRIADLCTIFVSVMIMTTCYMLMATTLLKKSTSQNRIAVVTLTGSSERGPSSVVQKGRETTSAKDFVLEHNPSASTIPDEATVRVTIRPCEEVSHHENPGTSRVFTVVKGTARGQSGPSTISPTSVSATIKTTAAQTKMYKNVLLLFVITVVFVLCWMPLWLLIMGVAVPEGLRQMFLLNSVVNPFIYGFASVMFREDVRHFYRQTRIKLDTCYH